MSAGDQSIYRNRRQEKRRKGEWSAFSSIIPLLKRCKKGHSSRDTNKMINVKSHPTITNPPQKTTQVPFTFAAGILYKSELGKDHLCEYEMNG